MGSHNWNGKSWVETHVIKPETQWIRGVYSECSLKYKPYFNEIMDSGTCKAKCDKDPRCNFYGDPPAHYDAWSGDHRCKLYTTCNSSGYAKKKVHETYAQKYQRAVEKVQLHELQKKLH